MTIHDFEHKLLGLIDGMVATASDDELFAGAICGHISLAVARAELEGKTLVRDVKSYVLRSLNEAILQGSSPSRTRSWCRQCGSVCNNRRKLDPFAVQTEV
jgi:hypothetical protein